MTTKVKSVFGHILHIFHHGAVNINTVVEMLTTQIAVEVNPLETNFQPVKSVCMQITQITLEVNPTKINFQPVKSVCMYGRTGKICLHAEVNPIEVNFQLVKPVCIQK